MKLRRPRPSPVRRELTRPTDPTSIDARWTRGAWLFRDQTLRSLEILLDEAFRIPGTSFRFGIDGLIGLVPGLGDVIAGLLSAVIPLAGWVRGIPYVALVRMVLNIAVDVLIGSIPVVGDIFDVFWKANRRNYRILQRHLRQPHRHGWRDWAFLLVLIATVAAVLMIPLLLFAWLMHWLLHLRGPHAR